MVQGNAVGLRKSAGDRAEQTTEGIELHHTPISSISEVEHIDVALRIHRDTNRLADFLGGEGEGEIATEVEGSDRIIITIGHEKKIARAVQGQPDGRVELGQ